MEAASELHAATSPEAAALACRGLVVRYGDLVAVNGLDLTVHRGECFGLLGPNGAGKTTTVEVFEGLIQPAAGDVVVLGQRWDERGGRRLRRRLGVALQETRLPELLTVEETLRVFRSFYPAGRGVDEVVEMLGLEEKRRARVGKLSGGQRQRLALACALVGAPDLLFLDEPTTGLDPQARHRIWDVVAAFRAEGGSVMLTTHYMDEAARLCDRVGIIDHGRLIAEDTPSALVRSLGGEQVVHLELNLDLDPAALADVPAVRNAARYGEGLRFVVTDAVRAVPALLEKAAALGAEVRGLATHEASLEDVFVHLTGRGLRDG